jgi:hypothetical protein
MAQALADSLICRPQRAIPIDPHDSRKDAPRTPARRPIFAFDTALLLTLASAAEHLIWGRYRDHSAQAPSAKIAHPKHDPDAGAAGATDDRATSAGNIEAIRWTR